MYVANNVAKFANSRSFLRAEYVYKAEDEKYGTVVIDTNDGRKLEIYRVSVMDWLSLYVNTTDEVVDKLT